ncbi:MAG: lasso peptide biosynthesis B2 protein [Prolixibacteraceae bacterium]
MKRVRKFIRLPAGEKKLFAEAVFFLFFAKVFLLLPFRICVKRLKPAGNKIGGEADTRALRNIRDAIGRANKLAWWKNICLVKSIAARLMLQRRNIGSVMYLGLQFKNGKELIAHAWLKSGDLYITPKGNMNYKEIFTL